MSDTQKIKDEIEELKKKLREKQGDYRTTKGLLVEDDLKKMTVNDLKKLITKHKLFKGTSAMRKQQLIDKIISSSWFEKQPPELPPKPIIKKKDEPPPTEEKQEEKQEEKKGVEPPIKEEEIKGLEELDDTDDFIKDEEYKKLPRKQKRRKKIGFVDTSTKDKPIELNIDDAHKYSIGHAIINIYTGGSSNPNIPIPQHVVRSAINAQLLPQEDQQEIHNIVKNTPKFIPPPPPIPQATEWKGRAVKPPPVELTEEQKKAQEDAKKREKHMDALREAIEARRKKIGN